MKLVVNNAPQPVEPPPSDADLRLDAQAALVRAAKKHPLRVIVIADLGEGETGVWVSGLSRDGAVSLAKVGVKNMLDGMP